MSRRRRSVAPTVLRMAQAQGHGAGMTCGEAEAELQLACEQALEVAGFRRRTHEAIRAGRPPAGWFFHFPQARGNPLVLDLLVLLNNGEWLEVELKGAATRIAEHQRLLVEQNPQRRAVVRSVMELAEMVERAAGIGEVSMPNTGICGNA